MTLQEKKFYKVWVYYIAFIVLSLIAVLSMFSGHHDESRHFFTMAIIFYITSDIRGDIFQLRDNQK